MVKSVKSLNDRNHLGSPNRGEKDVSTRFNHQKSSSDPLPKTLSSSELQDSTIALLSFVFEVILYLKGSSSSELQDSSIAFNNLCLEAGAHRAFVFVAIADFRVVNSFLFFILCGGGSIVQSSKLYG